MGCFQDELEEEAVNIFSYFRRWLKPHPKDRFPVIITPFIMAFLASVFVGDLILSEIYCHNVSSICDQVYEIPWGQFLKINAKDNPWTTLTYALHHLTFTHIFCNLVMIWFVYQSLESRFGSLRIAISMVMSAFGASLLWWLWGSNVAIIGFSGVDYCGACMYIGENIMNWKEEDPLTKKPRSHFWFFVLIPSIILEFILEAYFITGYASLGHLGGAISGLSYAILFLPHFKEEKWEYALMAVSGVIILLQFLVLPLVLFYG